MGPSTNKKPAQVPFLSLAAVSFILGIILAASFNPVFKAVFILSLCVMAVSMFLGRRPKSGYAILFLFMLVGLMRQASFASLPSDDIYYLSRHKLNGAYITGRVISHVQDGPYDRSFVFLVRTVRTDDFGSRVSGKVHVRFNKWVDISYGDELAITGKLSDLKDSGYFNKRLIRQGIRSVLYVGKKDWIEIEESSRFSLQRSAFWVKEALKQRFARLRSPAKDILVALILGDRGGLSKELYALFKYTGTVHILAVSGLHIGIVIFILLMFLKALRIKLRMRFVITVIFLVFYSFITGLRPSVVRAVIMGVTFLLSFIVKREYHIYNSLALAALIILGFWPWQVFDIGFQLSFLSVLSIVSISPKVITILPKAKNRFISFIQVSFVVSLSAGLGTVGLVAYYFGMVSLVSPLANVFIVALMPVILAAGFIYLLASFVSGLFASWLALSLEFMVGILIHLAIIFKSVPFAYFFVERLPLFFLFVYYGLVVILVYNLNKYNGFEKHLPR